MVVASVCKVNARRHLPHGLLAARLLAARLPRERHRAVGDGRLQPDAGGLPVRPAGALRLRPGAEDRRRRGRRPQRPAAALPQRRAADADRRPQPDPGQLDDDRDRRLLRLALDRRLLLGGDGHRLLPHLPRRVPRLGRAEAVLLRDARRRPALHRRQHLRADDRERASSPAPTNSPSASPTSARSTRSCCSARRPAGHLPDLRGDLLGGAERPHALARGLARGAVRHRRRRPRQLALPDLPRQRLQPLPLRLDPRLHPHRPALVLRAQPGADGRRRDQLAALRGARHGRTALPATALAVL